MIQVIVRATKIGKVHLAKKIQNPYSIPYTNLAGEAFGEHLPILKTWLVKNCRFRASCS